MKKKWILVLQFIWLPILLIAQFNPKAIEDANNTIEKFKEKNEKLNAYFENAYAYAVFPSIGKGAYVIGGARGAGTVFEKGIPIGKAVLTQVTVGLQWGGQSYSQVVFFETKKELKRFKKNKMELSAQASAIAIEEGAAATLAYRDGVAVFTMTKGGLMAEASVGVQKFKFKAKKY